MDVSFLDAGTLITLLIFVVTFVMVMLYMWTPKTDIPGPFALPIIGNLPLLLRVKETERHLFMQEMEKKYGSVYRLFYGKQMIVFVNGHDAINSVFVKQAHLTTDRPEMMSKLSGDNEIGIVQENGPVWRSLRRVSLQSMRDFGVGKKSMGDVINEEVLAVMKYIESKEGQPFEHEELWRKITTNVIHCVVFGFRYEHTDQKFQEFLDAFDKMFAGEGTTSTRKVIPWLRYFSKKSKESFQSQMDASVKIREYIKQQMSEHKKTYDPNHCRDFIDLYLQLENAEYKTEVQFSAQAMAATILQLFAAGTDTTAHSINWSMLYMLGYSDAQKKCQDEIDKFVGHGRMVTLDDRDQLIYVQATLLEIQRISSIATATLPHVTTGEVKVDGYTIPKGTIVRGNILTSLRDTKCWNEPLKFDPNRFISPEGKLLKKDGFIPFSLGPRICPGEPLAKMEMFLVFANMIQRFTLEKPSSETKLDFNGYSSVAFRPHPFKMRALLR